MPNTYTITVQNNSGSNQSYALFNEVPKLESSVNSKVWSNALKVVHAGPSSSLTFTISSQSFAYVGSSSGVPGQDGVEVSIANATEVELGSTDLEGNQRRGTTLNMDVVGMAPQFVGNTAPGGRVGAFGIQTAAGNDENQFTYNNARDSEFQPPTS
jgi:hypothetical protein